MEPCIPSDENVCRQGVIRIMAHMQNPQCLTLGGD